MIPAESNGNYGPMAKLLHWIALAPNFVRHTSFEMECAQFHDSSANGHAGSVYVSGLARSGTTLVLNILAQSPEFRSLTYADMPFVMAPNMWARLHRHDRSASTKSVERAHGDGVEVSSESPEAFEEIFWETFRNTPNPQGTFANAPSREALDKFRMFRSVVANPKGAKTRRRYLSKNNNNLTRMQSLSSEPGATFLLVYRDPVATAISLHTQHRRFLDLLAKDPFGRRYMEWLAHHEFGGGFYPFEFAKAGMDSSLSPLHVGFWLNYWNSVYSKISSGLPKGIALVDYDTLCGNPKENTEKLFLAVNTSASESGLIDIKNPGLRTKINLDGFRTADLENARVIHSALKANMSNIF